MNPEHLSLPATVHWHALTPAAAGERVRSDPAAGLSAGEALRRAAEFGPNALPEARRRSLLAVFLRQFVSPLIYILFIAAAIAFTVGHRRDAGVILIVVFINACIGTFQEGRAERSMESLRKLSTLRVRVRRGGREELLEARDLVPGDILLLAAGDAVAADARLLEAAALEAAEAALTGESLPVAKHPGPLPPRHAPGRPQEHGLFRHAHRRRARARGRHRRRPAARAALHRDPHGRDQPDGVDGAGGVAGGDDHCPRGQMQRMAARKAVVRRLAAVETLGSTSVICSDKTGTLTRNEMTVTALWLPDGRTVEVTGAGYAPRGALLEDGREPIASDDPVLRALLEAAALCNDAQLVPPDNADPRWRPLGDPTEAALLTLALKGCVDLDALRRQQPRRAEIPFDSAAKMMATQHGHGPRGRICLKGAPEMVLELCASAGADFRREFEATSARFASGALRLLAVAELPDAAIDAASDFGQFKGRAVFLGLVGQMDPPREEVKAAVRECQQAGIRPVMVTGDHKVTGLAVARTLGLAREGDLAVDGRELERMPEQDLRHDLDRISVFARVHPAQKLRIVEAFQSRRQVVAMTGDGVNDAPALARADAGVAMGITGTEVAKGATKIVIADDNFATIVSAVEEGRLVNRNLKKVILFLFVTSIDEVVVLLAALFPGYPLPLAAVQILWINLVTEGVLTVNLVMEGPEGDERRRQ